MAKLNIDITGALGLAPGYFGNLDQLIPTPQQQYLAQPGQLLDGFFNSFSRDGYLAPAVATTIATQVTSTTTLTTTLGSSVDWQEMGVALAPAVLGVTPTISGTPISGGSTASVITFGASMTVPSNSTQVLVVLVLNPTGGLVSSVTWLGTPMTLAVSTVAAWFGAIYYLINPTPGTGLVTLTWGTFSSRIGFTAACFQGVNQTTPIATTGIPASTSASASIGLSTGSNNMVISNTESGFASHTQAGGQTEIANQDFGGLFTYSSSYKASSASALSAVIGSQVYDAVNVDVYFAERGRYIYEQSDLDTLNMNQVIDASSGSVIHDLEIYQLNGVRTGFVVYANGGNLNIGSVDLPMVNFNADWLTADASGAFTAALTSAYAFMRVADNSFAYFFQDNNVHKLDGTAATGGSNGTVTQQALVFPVTFRIVDAIDYRGNMFIALHQAPINSSTSAATGNNVTTACGVYIWDRQTTVATISDFIPVQGVSAITRIYIAPNGNIRLQCLGSNKFAQIREFDGANFQVIEEFGLGAAVQYPDGLTTASNGTYWLGSDGTFYAQARNNPKDPVLINKLGYVKAPSTTAPATNITAGAIFYGAGNTYTGTTGYRLDRQGFTLGYADGSSYYAVKFYPYDINVIGAYTQLALAGNVSTPLALLPLSKVNYIRVWHNVGVTSGTTQQGTLSVYLNQSASSINDVSITRNDIVKGWKYIPIGQSTNKNAVFALQFKIAWDTTQTLSDNYDWLPRMIEIDYEPTTKLQ